MGYMSEQEILPAGTYYVGVIAVGHIRIDTEQ